MIFRIVFHNHVMLMYRIGTIRILVQIEIISKKFESTALEKVPPEITIEEEAASGAAGCSPLL
ncbi:MAG: hypothetical protein ACLSCV_05230 [Acutalibacteraceae bacterium]